MLFHITFAINAFNDSYGIWTSLTMVLMVLNITITDFKKLTALTVNDLHSPTISCPLNFNKLLLK
jgi:hypothetical protein